MTIIAKHIERSNLVWAFGEKPVVLPEPAQLFAAYPGELSKGSVFTDNPALATRVFEFPVPGFLWIFEPNRIRLEDKMRRLPADSKLAHEMSRVLSVLYPNVSPVAYGYNYDILFRMDNVIPTDLILGNFLKKDTLQDVRDFGWQYTIGKDKDKRLETYFFKVVSPIEYSVHANYHFNEQLPKEADVQKGFERSYANVDNALRHIAI